MDRLLNENPNKNNQYISITKEESDLISIGSRTRSTSGFFAPSGNEQFLAKAKRSF
jgi:hypothetical protein